MTFNLFDQLAAGNYQDHNIYFNTFVGRWQGLLSAGHLKDAEEIWQLALAPIIEGEKQHPGKLIHKGTPLYFWGMTSILKGDLDKGYALMHQALKEDIRTVPAEYKVQPAYAFVTLDYDNPYQAFRHWLLHEAEFLAHLIENYSHVQGHELTLELFRDRFLKATENLNAVFSFAHTLSHLLAADEIPEYSMKNEFVGQLEMGLLFNILMIIETAIQEKNPTNQTFKGQIEFLAKKAGLKGLSRVDIGDLNAYMDSSPQETLASFLDGTFFFNDTLSVSGLENSLCTAYCLRNHIAHQLAPIPIVWERYKDVRQYCLNVLFLAVETLY